MAFDTQTVTIKGAELLAAATAQDKLIIVGCDATQTYMTQAQAVTISARPASPFSNTTSVTQIGSTSDHINSRVYFRAGDNTGGDANTLFLYGHKESDPSNDYVIFIASAQTAFHLPEVGDVVDEWETALDIVYTISTDSVGYATQATYCTLSEFNLLKERTVTTHKEGLPNQGDNQSIRGNKTFINYADFDDQVTCNDVVLCKDDLHFYCVDNAHGIWFDLDDEPETKITSDNTSGGTIFLTAPRVSLSGSLYIQSTANIDLKGYLICYKNILFYNEMTNQSVDVISSNSDYGVQNTDIADIQNVRNCTINGDLTANGDIIANVPGSSHNFYDVEINNTIIIGNSSNSSTWNQTRLSVYGESVIYSSLSGSDSNADMVLGFDKLAFRSKPNASTNAYSKIGVEGISCHNNAINQDSNRVFSVSNSSNVVYVGSVSHNSSLNIYGQLGVSGTASMSSLSVSGTSNFVGLITGSNASLSGDLTVTGDLTVNGAINGGMAPTYDSTGQGTLIPRIGGYVIAAIKSSVFPNPSANAGVSITLGEGDAKVCYMGSSGFTDGPENIYPGTYVLITDVTRAQTTGYDNYALLIRVA